MWDLRKSVRDFSPSSSSVYLLTYQVKGKKASVVSQVFSTLEAYQMSPNVEPVPEIVVEDIPLLSEDTDPVFRFGEGSLSFF